MDDLTVPAHPSGAVGTAPAGVRAPASAAQHRVWLAQRLAPTDPSQHLVIAMRIAGSIDAAALRETVVALVDRHEALRTVFTDEGGELEQVLDGAGPPTMEFVDLRRVAPTRREQAARQHVTDFAATPFDLTRGPLLRIALVQLDRDDHVLATVVHQIIFDDWSATVFTRDLRRLYAAATVAGTPALPPLPIQFADYVAWHHDRMAGREGERQLSWWQHHLRDAPPTMDLAARGRRQKPTWATDSWTFVLPPDLVHGLDHLRRRCGATMFMALIALFQVLLARVSGQRDVVVGTPSAGRTHPQTEDLIGFFVNLLPLRLDLSDDPTFLEAVTRVQQLALQAYANQDVPFDRIVRAVQAPRSTDEHPVFQILFNFFNTPGEATTCGKIAPPAPRVSDPVLPAVPFPVPHCGTTFDLALNMGWSGPSVWGEIEYRRRLFDERGAADLAHRLVVLGRAAVADPTMPVSRLALLDPDERQRLVAQAGPAGPTPPIASCIHELFVAQATRTPSAVALVDGDRRVTFRQLARRSAGIAHRLRELGVGPEQRVGLCLAQSPDLIAAMLAVMQAGGAYVPLNPAYPAIRVAELAADAGIAVAIAHRATAPLVAGDGMRALILDDPAEETRIHHAPDTPPATQVGPENLAYAIYTSGSTGRPKAVLVPHRAAVNTYYGYRHAYGLGERPLNHLQSASMSFDVCTGDLLRGLLNGGSLVLCPRDTLLDTPRLYHLLHAENIGCAELVPAVVRALTAYAQQIGGNLHTFEVFIVGSDSWFASEFAATKALLHPSAKLINVFGITETAIDSTSWQVRSDNPIDGSVVPIGRPFLNQRAYVLDHHGGPVPPGATGELYIGGGSVTRGYQGRADLTATRFVADPFAADGSRLYRTGDAARRGHDGVIDFIGRVDHQINVRGHRIEPAEVEAALCEHNQVLDAAVADRRDGTGSPQLVAWYVSTRPGHRIDASELRNHLRDRLPGHLVPAVFTAITALPHNNNGKIDRPRLGELPVTDHRIEEPPATSTEQVVASVWGDVLGVDVRTRHADFFALGGHSLLAAQIVGRLGQRLRRTVPLRTVFDAPILHEFAAVLDDLREAEAGPSPAPTPSPTVALEVTPASFAQQRLWFLDRLTPGAIEYNVPLGLRLRGRLDTAALGRALTGIVARHESLRTTFAEHDGAAVQLVGSPYPVELPRTDAHGEADARTLAAAEAAKPFDLAAGPLLRARLIRLADDDHVLVVVLHHIVADEWSAIALQRELADSYAAARADAPDPAPPALQYRDYARWQRRWLTSGGRQDRQLRYWRHQLAGLAVLDLPTDRPRPPRHDPTGGLVTFDLPASTADRLRVFARDQGATTFMTLLTGFTALLHRYTGAMDIPIGTPVAGRSHPDLEPLLGLFVNTLVLRLDATNNPTITQLLHRVRHTALDAYANQDLPFEQLVEHLAPHRDQSRHPLFQVNFTVLDAREQAVSPIADIAFADFPVACSTSKFDLRLVVTETTAGLHGDIEYATALFDRDRMQRMATHLAAVYSAIADEPEQRLSELPIMTTHEITALPGWTTRTSSDPPVTLPRLIDEQIRRHPKRTALSDARTALTYLELGAAVTQLAARLRAAGVGPDTVVAIALPHTTDLVVAMLAIWRARGAYVALDPAAPLSRIGEQLRVSTASVVLTTGPLVDTLPATRLPILYVEDPGPADVDGTRRPSAAQPLRPANLAYVVFTSGTTGRPKAVAVTHQALGRYAVDATAALAVQPATSWTLVSPLSVDLGLTNVVGALATGGCLHLAPPDQFPRAFTDQPPGCAKLTPTHLGVLLDEPDGARRLPRELLVLGGEPTSPAQLTALRTAGWSGRLYNHYGPAEATIGTHIGEMHHDGRSLGRPLPSVICRVLDRYGRPAPVGVPGELHLGGPQLARGYLGRGDLTAERLVADPFGAPGGRLYRTGDLVAWQRDGRLLFLGRVDHRLSLRGFRIDPAEVEEALLSHPEVSGASVETRADERADSQLVAWLAPAVPIGIRPFLRARLPDYLVPSAYVAVPQLPRTSAGKLDRAALPDPISGLRNDATDEVGQPPSTTTERLLGELWSELLQVDTIGRDDDFFDLGGHSLRAIRLIGRIVDRLGVEVPLRAVFESPRLSELAAHIDRHGTAAPDALPPADRRRPLPASFAQERLWLLHQLNPGSVEYRCRSPSAWPGRSTSPLWVARCRP